MSNGFKSGNCSTQICIAYCKNCELSLVRDCFSVIYYASFTTVYVTLSLHRSKEFFVMQLWCSTVKYAFGLQ